MVRILFVIALCDLLLGARALAPARDVDMLRAALAAKPAAPLARGDAAAPTAATGRREAAVQTGLSAAALLFARVAEVDASGGATAGKLTTRVAAKKRSVVFLFLLHCGSRTGKKRRNGPSVELSRCAPPPPPFLAGTCPRCWRRRRTDGYRC